MEKREAFVASKAKNLGIFLALATVSFCGGCEMLGVLGSSRRSEGKVPAEYDLREHKDQKILVLVDQPGWLNAQANLRYYLTDAINKNIVVNLKINPENLVEYDKLSLLRSNRADFSLLGPVEIGTALDANTVLLVTIEDCQLSEVGEPNYYKGLLSARAALLDTASGKKLWPKSDDSKSISVGFDIEERGREIAVIRLAGACAYCTVRYLYDCPRNKFEISEDRSDVDWGRWDK